MVGDEVKVVNIRSKIEVEKIRESGRIVYETLSAIEENILLHLIPIYMEENDKHRIIFLHILNNLKLGVEIFLFL